jgi:hypothetical protein
MKMLISCFLKYFVFIKYFESDFLDSNPFRFKETFFCSITPKNDVGGRGAQPHGVTGNVDQSNYE